jgi:hypothetical protein
MNKSQISDAKVRHAYGLKMGLQGEELITFSITPASIAEDIVSKICGQLSLELHSDILGLLNQLVSDETNSGHKLAGEIARENVADEKYTVQIFMVVMAFCAKTMRSYKELDLQTAWVNACSAHHWNGVLLMHLMAWERIGNLNTSIKQAIDAKAAAEGEFLAVVKKANKDKNKMLDKARAYALAQVRLRDFHSINSAADNLYEECNRIAIEDGVERKGKKGLSKNEFRATFSNWLTPELKEKIKAKKK